MTVDEFVTQQHGIQEGAYFKDGVWWHQTSLGRSHPLYPLQKVVPRKARPPYLKSLLGYWHLAPSGVAANFERTLIMLSRERLAGFCFEGLPYEKRKAINRASKRGVIIKKLISLEDSWESLQAVFISMAQRTQYGPPERYYTERNEEWKRGLRRQFSLPGRDWFGAWCGEELVGYMYSCLIDDEAFLMTTRFNSDYLEARPSDALHYHVLCYYRDHAGCHTVTAGTANRMVPSIDAFKRKFGFEEVRCPAFSRTNYFAKVALQTALGCAALGAKWQSADSKRNLRYKVGLLRRALSDW